MKLPVLKVSERLYRSPQPEFEDLLKLSSRGLKGLVNLREEATESSFFARQAGLRYLYLPVVDWDLPSRQQVQEFIDFLEEDENSPALVHCAMGVGRTGTFVACYRILKGMEPEAAIQLTNDESPLPGVSMNKEQQMFVREFK